MTWDGLKNFAYSTVATAPSPATSGTSLVVGSGHGGRFPATPFQAVVWPSGALPTPANAEVIRVTALSTDTFSTIVRAQESSSARSIVVGDQIAAAITAKTLTDIQSAVDGITGGSSSYLYAIVANQQTAGTDGGSTSSGAWNTATINTEVNDPNSICSISSNQVTLSSGTYLIEGGMPIYSPAGRAAIKLRNVTDSITLVLGSVRFEANGSENDTVWCNINGMFTIGASKALEVQYRTTTSRSGNGQGVSANWGETEQFLSIRFTKIA